MNSERDSLLHQAFIYPYPIEATERSSFLGRISTHVACRFSVPGYEEVQGNVSLGGAVINTLCNVVGAGVLALPFALCQASVLGGLLLMGYTAILAGFSAFAVINACEITRRFSFTEIMAFAMFPLLTFDEFCQEKLSLQVDERYSEKGNSSEVDELHQRYLDSEIARRKLRRIVTIVVDLIIFLSNYGTLVIYARVISDSIPPVIKQFLHGSGIFVTPAFWLIVSGIVFFGVSCVRNMSELRFSSLLGFLTILYIILTVIARYFTSRQNPPYPDVDPSKRGEINWFHAGTGLFSIMSIYGVAFSYHYNLPYFYRELKHRTPTNMMKSVYIAFSVILACYALTGVFGYLTFGNLLLDASTGGEIVRSYPADDVVVNIGRLGLFIHFSCVYPILSVGARRGLHRILMNLLMWNKMTAILEGTTALTELGGRANSEFAVCDDTNCLPAGLHADRDIGSPEDTTRLAIVLEALFIVVTSVLLGGLISGISIAIDFLGLFFSIFLMLTGPSIIAWLLFSRARRMGRMSYRSATTFMGFAVVGFLTGIFFLVTGFLFLVKKYAA